MCCDLFARVKALLLHSISLVFQRARDIKKETDNEKGNTLADPPPRDIDWLELPHETPPRSKSSFSCFKSNYEDYT